MQLSNPKNITTEISGGTQTNPEDQIPSIEAPPVRTSVITQIAFENLTQSQIALLLPDGLQSLIDVDTLKIKQELEFFEMFGVETKNKYSIRDTNGKRLFYAAESTGLINRCCIGKNRPFTIKLYDSKSNLVMKVHRNCSCALCCCGGSVAGSSVTIKSARTDELYGQVVQVCNFCTPKFNVINNEGEKILQIKGPCGSTWCKCRRCCDVEFNIFLTTGGQHQYIGQIMKQYSLKEMIGDANNFCLVFPKELDPKVKACLIGAGFSLDYAFFETHANHHRCCSKITCETLERKISECPKMAESRESSQSDASEDPRFPNDSRRFSFDDPPRFLNISDLRLELQTIDTLTSELTQLRKDFQEMLLENRSETKKVSQELLSFDEDLDEDSYEIPEKKTVRQLLEDLTSDMKHLKAEIKDIKIRSQTMEKNLTDVLNKSHVNTALKIPELPSPLLTMGNEIYSMSEADQSILKEINILKAYLEPSIKDGKTLQGTSFSEFSMSIPKNHEATLAVEFTNYLKEPLSKPLCWYNYGTEQQPLPLNIVGTTREAFGFHSKNLTCSGGIFSYEIGSRNLRFVICYYIHSIGNAVLAMAALPKEVPVNKDLEQSLWSLTGEKNFGAKRCPGTSGGELVMKLDDLRVRVALTRGPRARMRTEILQVTESAE
ncbi:unnamed protein product [Allacma fusca]|uniref:Phospholipid scramblase n=1 Tax=Allacma fusca TaxID=39272 RepID=A0A8J2PA92_9HEXA|nr:unnamed protein product [Allacma fusca]